jgi:outer membrane lipoprotein SlyB
MDRRIGAAKHGASNMTAFETIRTMFVALALAPAQSGLLAQPYAPGDFDACETLTAGTSAGTVESVREVALVSDMHAFDPGVLEHPVRPETAEELVIRLDVGPFITFTNKDPQRLRAGQRVRVILTASSARVELDRQRCSSPLAYYERD